MRVLLLVLILTLSLGSLPILQAEEASGSADSLDDAFHNWVATMLIWVQDRLPSIQLGFRGFRGGLDSRDGDFGPAIDPDGLLAVGPSSEARVLRIEVSPKP